MPPIHILPRLKVSSQGVLAFWREYIEHKNAQPFIFVIEQSRKQEEVEESHRTLVDEWGETSGTQKGVDGMREVAEDLGLLEQYNAFRAELGQLEREISNTMQWSISDDEVTRILGVFDDVRSAYNAKYEETAQAAQRCNSQMGVDALHMLKKNLCKSGQSEDTASSQAPQSVSSLQIGSEVIVEAQSF